MDDDPIGRSFHRPGGSVGALPPVELRTLPGPETFPRQGNGERDRYRPLVVCATEKYPFLRNRKYPGRSDYILLSYILLLKNYKFLERRDGLVV